MESNIKKTVILLLILILIAYSIYLTLSRIRRRGDPLIPSKTGQWRAEGPREPSDEMIPGGGTGPSDGSQPVLSIPSQESGLDDIGDRAR
jgi:hypothetical protein